MPKIFYQIATIEDGRLIPNQLSAPALQEDSGLEIDAENKLKVKDYGLVVIPEIAELPTLGSSDLGKIYVYKNRTIIWDGSRWKAVPSNEWYVLDELLSTPNSDSTVVTVSAAALFNSDYNIFISIGYDNSFAATLGALHFIGHDDIEEFFLIDGRRVVVTAKDGAYFHIKNESTETLPSGHKPIITGTEGDIFDCIKAEFVYSLEDDAWLLVSYELRPSWFRLVTVSAVSELPNQQYTGRAPVSPTNGLILNGYYQVDIFLRVEELEADEATPSPTATAQTLELKGTDATWLIIDVSGNAGSGVNWYNNSLQGSAVVYVNDAVCANRRIEFRLTLPNGVVRNLLGGYIHIEYLGKEIGSVCST